MKHSILRACLLLLLLLGLAMPAMAQDNKGGREPFTSTRLGISGTAPSGWEIADSLRNTKTIASFTHPASKTQIEIVGTQLINKDIAQVFFNTVHDTLKGSDFQEITPPTPATIAELQGKQSEYAYEYTGMTLRIVVFSFVKNDAAYLVIGYFKSEERDAFYESIVETISSFNFS